MHGCAGSERQLTARRIRADFAGLASRLRANGWDGGRTCQFGLRLEFVLTGGYAIFACCLYSRLAEKLVAERDEDYRSTGAHVYGRWTSTAWILSATQECWSVSISIVE